MEGPWTGRGGGEAYMRRRATGRVRGMKDLARVAAEAEKIWGRGSSS